MVDGGSGVAESHRGIGTYNANLGDALNHIGNRGAERELKKAYNTRRVL